MQNADPDVTGGPQTSLPPWNHPLLCSHTLTICVQNNRGEQTASALEANLTNLESRLDEILASFGMSADDLDDPVAKQEASKSDGDEKGDQTKGGA